MHSRVFSAGSGRNNRLDDTRSRAIFISGRNTVSRGVYICKESHYCTYQSSQLTPNLIVVINIGFHAFKNLWVFVNHEVMVMVMVMEGLHSGNLLAVHNANYCMQGPVLSCGMEK